MGDENAKPTAKSGIARSPKFWLGAALTVVFLIFVAQNHGKVTVSYVFFEKDSYLIWVMLGCGVIGFLVGWLWGRPARVMSKRNREDGKEKS